MSSKVLPYQRSLKQGGVFMLRKTSAGLLMYRWRNQEPEIFLAHPGGPYYVNKGNGYWGIPKGEVEQGEELLAAAVREFEEETGLVPAPPFLPLGSIHLKSGKTVYAWAFSGDWDGMTLTSNVFEIEWPPKSGQKKSFPELDKAAFFSFSEARQKINPSQLPLLDRLERLVGKKPMGT